MLRMLFIVGLVVLFTVPVYNLLKRRATSVKKELEDSNDIAQRLLEYKAENKKLKRDAADEERLYKKQAEHANKIKKQL